MKKIISLLFFIIVSFVSVSCDKEHDEFNPNDISKNTYFCLIGDRVLSATTPSGSDVAVDFREYYKKHYLCAINVNVGRCTIKTFKDKTLEIDIKNDGTYSLYYESKESGRLIFPVEHYTRAEDKFHVPVCWVFDFSEKKNDN